MKERLFTRIPKKLFSHVEQNTPEETALVEFQQSQTDVVTAKYYNGAIVLDDVPPFDEDEFDIYDDKDFKKYINEIEKVCRTSFEYESFVSYLREYMDMNKCSFFKNVSNKDTFKIRIELHHCPFTLYDIVMTIFNKRVFYHQSLEVEMVAKEVMYIHYFCMIGIIPLAETVHELVHNRILFIPLDTVFGNYQEFINVYGEFIPKDAMERFDLMVEQTLAYNEAANLQVLQQSPMIVQLPGDDGSGTYNLPKLEVIVDLMQDRLLELKESPQQLIEENGNSVVDSEAS